MLGKLSIKSDNIIISLFITDAEFEYLNSNLIVAKSINFRHSTHLTLVQRSVLSIFDIQPLIVNDNKEDN